MLTWITNYLNNWARARYETKILNYRYGAAQFVANFAFIQMGPQEHLWLTSPSKRLGDLRVSAIDSRPLLTYKLWPGGMEWSESLPVIECIVELRQFQVRFKGDADWQLIPFDEMHLNEQVKYLLPLFQAYCFYPYLMRAEHKKTDA